MTTYPDDIVEAARIAINEAFGAVAEYWEGPLPEAVAKAIFAERERCARVVETALVDDFTRKTGQPRGNSEAKVFLASAIRNQSL